MKKNALLAIRIISALVFIISALSKLFPAEVFELTLINAGVAAQDTAPYLARFIIAVELFLGITLLQKNFLKRLIVPASVLLLFVFSVHLIYTIARIGNTGNCGCFGELIPMSPLEALIKNVVLIALLVYFYFSYSEEAHNKLWVPAVVFLFSLIVVPIIAPIQKIEKDKPLVLRKAGDTAANSPAVASSSDTGKEASSSTASKTTALHPDSTKKQAALLPKKTSVFANFHYFNDSAYVDLDKGIKIAALLSLDCDHCMAAAKAIVQLKKEMKLPPVYFLYLGEPDQLKEFYAQSGAQNIPYKIINARTFFSLINESPPRIVLLNNGNITEDWNTSTFSKEALKKALK